MKRLAFDFARSFSWFWLAAVGVPTLLILILPFIGYSAYGDRPEEGWYGLPSGITWEQVRGHLEFVGGFVWLWMYSLPWFALLFTVPFAVVRVAEKRLPVRVVQVVAALLTGLLAWFTIGSIGWYISISLLAGLSGIGAAALSGAACLARRRFADAAT